MNKFFISLLFVFGIITSVHAGGNSFPVIEELENQTTNGFTVTFSSVPAYTGNRKWSIRISSRENPLIEFKNIPAFTNRTDLILAPKNCESRRELDCSFRRDKYVLTDNQIQCGTRYNVVLRVESLDNESMEDSQPKSITTTSCASVGTVSIDRTELVKKDETTATLNAIIKLNSFTGEQEPELFIAIKEGDQSTIITDGDYVSYGKKKGVSSVVFNVDIPNLVCSKKYVYRVKVKLGTIEGILPPTGSFSTEDTFICSGSSVGAGGDGGGAQTGTGNNYVFLTPLPLNEGLTPQESVLIGGVGENGIFGVLQRIFTLMLVVAIVLAVVFMIIGGARYATGDTLSGKQGGRQMITNAVTGLLFALLSWLLLNIINPDLLRFTLELPNVGKSNFSGFTGGNSGGGDGGGGTGIVIPGSGCNIPAETNEECFRRILADEPRVRQILKQEKIDINRGDTPCQRLGQEACTMVGLLNATTLNNLIAVKNECIESNSSCVVTITGGTEFWLHGEGGNHKRFTAVDLRIGERAFDTFIRSKTRTAAPFGACRETFTHRNLRFCNENGSHWHVDTVQSSSNGGPSTGALIQFKNIGVSNAGVWGRSSGTFTQVTGTEISAMIACTNRHIADMKTAIRGTGVDYKVFRALIAAESCGDPQALNPRDPGVGACGIAQTLVSTAREVDRSLERRFINEPNDTVVCTTLRSDALYSLKIGAKYLSTRPGSSPKEKLAAYNGGTGQLGATAPSKNCPGLMRFECPWEDQNSLGELIPSPCYDRSKPNDRPERTDCNINTGYEGTRFYVDKILQTASQINN